MEHSFLLPVDYRKERIRVELSQNGLELQCGPADDTCIYDGNSWSSDLKGVLGNARLGSVSDAQERLELLFLKYQESELSEDVFRTEVEKVFRFLADVAKMANERQLHSTLP